MTRARSRRTARLLSLMVLGLTALVAAACGEDALPTPSTPPPTPTPCVSPGPGQDCFNAKVSLATQPDGLKIGDFSVGAGAAAKAGDKATVQYTGWLADGQQFDSSRGKQPFTFTIGQGVIKGWSEGVPGMKPGGRRRLVVPPALAYGPAGQSQIPPNATLTFDIELVSIG